MSCTGYIDGVSNESDLQREHAMLAVDMVAVAANMGGDGGLISLEYAHTGADGAVDAVSMQPIVILDAVAMYVGKEAVVVEAENLELV